MIDTSSVYKLELELAKLPDKQGTVSKLRAEAIKKVDTVQMELDIFIAEMVSEICKEEGIATASGRTEVRRTRVLLEPMYKKLRKLLIKSTEEMNIVNSSYFNLNNRCTILLELYKNARRQMYDNTYVDDESKERLSTKMERANDKLEYE